MQEGYRYGSVITDISAPSVCDLALFNLFISSVFFYICSIQNADDVIETNISKWRPRERSSKRLVICPPSLKNDLNNVAGIDDVKD